ncbi:mas-related G-protein coupled receptor member D-like [Empidonax traillii]|uniref:mas-related G-protein coupled receptor member D-like n=1 Tax=Empidonax traillii TaxID=164674 RepID=UPI000FFD85ED|nr:mas-related G-protein coupled receptor member D-like [Empidonax traillii]
MEETDPGNFTLTVTYTSLDIEEAINNTCSIMSYKLIVFGGVCLGISLCGLVGNGMVVWFLGFHAKQSPFTVYILNLAVADFSLILLFLLILMFFFTLVTFCTYLFEVIPLYKHFVFVVGFLCHVFDLSSLGLLTALSVERCVSVLFPLWYRCHRPRHLSGIVSGALWALAGLFVSSLYVTYTLNEEQTP